MDILHMTKDRLSQQDLNDSNSNKDSLANILAKSTADFVIRRFWAVNQCSGPTTISRSKNPMTTFETANIRLTRTVDCPFINISVHIYNTKWRSAFRIRITNNSLI